MEANKKDRREYHREYYKKNRERIIGKIAEKIICEDCGGRYVKCNKKEHFETKKHMKGLEIKILQEKINALEESNKNK